MRRTVIAAYALAFCLAAASQAAAQQTAAAQKEQQAAGSLAVEMDREAGRPGYVLANRSVWFVPARRIKGGGGPRTSRPSAPCR